VIKHMSSKSNQQRVVMDNVDRSANEWEKKGKVRKRRAVMKVDPPYSVIV